MRKLDLLDVPTCVSRREALSTLAASTLVGCYTTNVIHEPGPKADGGAVPDDAGDETVVCSSTGQDVGAVTSFPLGTWKEVGTLIVGHDSKGIFVFTAVCTHQGCVVDPPAKNGSTFCSCHGSQFDGNGGVLVGPAFSPLEHYAVEVCNGNVLVDTTTVVPTSTRTPIP